MYIASDEHDEGYWKGLAEHYGNEIITIIANVITIIFIVIIIIILSPHRHHHQSHC
jgi:uncharacterized membrane protein